MNETEAIFSRLDAAPSLSVYAEAACKLTDLATIYPVERIAILSVNRAEYCISKAGESMSRMVYAQRLAADGIQVFEIQPGVIRTDMIAAAERSYEERIAAGLVPQRRMGEGADVAKAVRAIADGLLDYATGQILNVDGGFHMRSL